MGAHDLSKHRGRVTDRTVDRTVEQIKASDLLKLMDVVKEATGWYNALEQVVCPSVEVHMEWQNLGEALRALGLNEVTP